MQSAASGVKLTMSAYRMLKTNVTLSAFRSSTEGEGKEGSKPVLLSQKWATWGRGGEYR